MIAPARDGAADDFDRSPLRRALVWLIAIKIAGIIVVFDPYSFSAFDLPKSLFSRALEWWIGGLLLASALRFGLSIVPRTRLHWAVGALVAVNLLSTAFAEDRYTALFGEFGRYLGLTFLMDMVVLYLAIAVAFRRRTEWIVLGAAIAAAASIAAGSAILQAKGLDAIASQVESRPADWGSALRATLARPLLGWGPDGFGIAFARYHGPPGELAEPGRLVYARAHDWVFQTATTTGAAGLLALIVLNGAGAVALARRVRRRGGTDRAIAAIALTALAAYWTLGLFAVGSIVTDWIPWVCLGVAATGSGFAPRPLSRPVVRPLLQVAILVVATVAPISELGALRGGRLVSDAAHFRATNPFAAFEAASGAVDLDGGRAHHWWIRGTSVEAAGLWRLAGDNYLEAASRYPYRADYWTSAALARARQALSGDLSSGGQAAAILAARRGVEAEPNDSVPHEAAAEILLAFGDRSAALREIVRAIELFPHDDRYDGVAREIADGDPDKADVGALIDEALRSKDSVLLRLAAANAALARGDRASARAHATRALELDPASASARQILADAQ